jgi:hypothetical protein
MRPICVVLLLLTCSCAARSTEPADQPVAESAPSATQARSEKTPAAFPDEHYFQLIETCARPAEDGNPIALVRAVNALIRLTDAEALRILRAYVAWRVDPDDPYSFDDYPSRVFSVARLAFVTAEGNALRRPGLGHFGIVTRQDSGHWPHAPLILCKDIPFEVSAGLALNGVAEFPERYLDYVAESGVLRREPLRPADNPLIAVDELLASEAWKDIIWEGDEPGHTWFLSEAWIQTKVRRQALQSLEGVYEPGEDIWSQQSHTGTYNWDKHLQHVSGLKPHWDASAQKYVAGN